MLTPYDVEMVKASELNDLNRLKGRHWTCAHCTMHCGDLKSREIVVEHLKSTYVFIPVPSLATTYLSYLLGMRSTHLASPKTYSSSHESTITMASRRATRLTLQAILPAACTDGSSRDAVIGFAVHGHYVSYSPFLSDLTLYSHPCFPVHVSYIVILSSIMYHYPPLRSILLSSVFPIHVSYILDR